MRIKVKLLEDGKAPRYKRIGDAALDCYSRVTEVVKKGETKTIPLGFCIEIPDGYKGRILPRSGYSMEGISVSVGTIENTYRGEVGATVFNHSQEDLTISKGDRIAQFELAIDVRVTEMEICDELSETERGTSGFGSSGRR